MSTHIAELGRSMPRRIRTAQGLIVLAMTLSTLVVLNVPAADAELIPLAGKWRTPNCQDDTCDELLCAEGWTCSCKMGAAAELGWYDTVAQVFHLCDLRSDDLKDCRSYEVPVDVSGGLPVVASWDPVESWDGVGIYFPELGRILRFEISSQCDEPGTLCLKQLPVLTALKTLGVLPLMGAWDGFADSPGHFQPWDGTFHFETEVTIAPYRLAAPPTALLPVAGDWDGDFQDTVGLYDEEKFTFYFTAEHGGVTQVVAVDESLPKELRPVAGQWATACEPRTDFGLFDPATAHFYLYSKGDDYDAKLPLDIYSDPGTR